MVCWSKLCCKILLLLNMADCLLRRKLTSTIKIAACNLRPVVTIATVHYVAAQDFSNMQPPFIGYMTLDLFLSCLGLNKMDTIC